MIWSTDLHLVLNMCMGCCASCSSMNGGHRVESEAPSTSSGNSDGSTAPVMNGDAESTPAHQTAPSTLNPADRSVPSTTGESCMLGYHLGRRPWASVKVVRLLSLNWASFSQMQTVFFRLCRNALENQFCWGIALSSEVCHFFKCTSCTGGGLFQICCASSAENSSAVVRFH